ncbi:MAG: signal peptidase II [Chlamydiia bacterium]|nr:signal peptidase II [Chlamydiia bacterium]
MKWVFFLSLLLLDIGSKACAIQYLPFLHAGNSCFPFGGIAVFADVCGISFSLNYTINTGAAWGLFSGHPGLLFGFRSVAIGCLSWYLLRKQTTSMSLWMVATGALGNAIDYLLYGHVIDFFHFSFWGRSFPIFNWADVYISVGAFFYFASGFLARRPRRQVS